MARIYPGAWYATREDVQASLDVLETSRHAREIDRALQASTEDIDGQLQRSFLPITDTRYFPWPDGRRSRSWRLWLDRDEIISATTVTAGGTTISSSDYFLEPVNDGPPYTSLEIDLSSSSALQSGTTFQRAIAITGVFGHSANTRAAGALAEALDASETGVDVTDSSLVGVGNVINVESERMIVTEKSMIDTGVDIDATDSLTASKADVSLVVDTATGIPLVGETILIDSERMRVVDATGTTLTLIRAIDGTVLATHATGASIYCPRTLTVERGALGTTAATHDTATAATIHVPPGQIRQLCSAEAIAGLLKQPDSELEALRERVYVRYGRKMRMAAI